MKFAVLFFLIQVLYGAEKPGSSIYNLDGKWKTHTGKTIQLSDLAGKPVVAAMVYTTCKHTCPVITKKVEEIRNSLPANLREKATYALISFDPVGDTPPALLKFKTQSHLDDHWVLLTSNELEVRKIAGVFGVNYKKMPDGGFSHSNIIVLLDSHGVIVSKLERLNQETGPFVKELSTLLN